MDEENTSRRSVLREKLRKQLEERPSPYISPIDGGKRSAGEETALNETFALVFRGRRGAEVLQHLESISIKRIGGPGIDPDTLMHLEGARYLFSVIQSRVDLGRAKK